MRRLLLALIAVLIIPGVAYAGGGGVDLEACAGYSEGTGIAMQDSCFSGTAHFAPSGTAITVTNNGFFPHSLTSVDGSVDTGVLESAGTAEVTFAEPGIYRVFCTLHGTAAGEGMAGVVVVGEAIPASVAAPLDVSGFEQSVQETLTAETESIRAAMENQGRTMGEIRSLQTKMALALEELSPAEKAAQTPAPEGNERLVILLGIGLAVGMALATMLTVLRNRAVGSSATRPDVLHTASE